MSECTNVKFTDLLPHHLLAPTPRRESSIELEATPPPAEEAKPEPISSLEEMGAAGPSADTASATLVEQQAVLISSASSGAEKSDDKEASDAAAPQKERKKKKEKKRKKSKDAKRRRRDDSEIKEIPAPVHKSVYVILFLFQA